MCRNVRVWHDIFQARLQWQLPSCFADLHHRKEYWSIVSNMMKHLKLNSILHPLQHSFWKNYSCETQLLSLFQDLASNPSQIDLIIMDFSKAFDKVPHRRLDYKLDWYGIRGNTREWILDFLSGRSQRVVLEGAASDSEPIVSSVPQGTLMEPFLFLLYINYLPDVAVHSSPQH